MQRASTQVIQLKDGLLNGYITINIPKQQRIDRGSMLSGLGKIKEKSKKKRVYFNMIVTGRIDSP